MVLARSNIQIQTTAFKSFTIYDGVCSANHSFTGFETSTDAPLKAASESQNAGNALGQVEAGGAQATKSGPQKKAPWHAFYTRWRHHDNPAVLGKLASQGDTKSLEALLQLPRSVGKYMSINDLAKSDLHLLEPHLSAGLRDELIDASRAYPETEYAMQVFAHDGLETAAFLEALMRNPSTQLRALAVMDSSPNKFLEVSHDLSESFYTSFVRLVGKNNEKALRAFETLTSSEGIVPSLLEQQCYAQRNNLVEAAIKSSKLESTLTSMSCRSSRIERGQWLSTLMVDSSGLRKNVTGAIARMAAAIFQAGLKVIFSPNESHLEHFIQRTCQAARKGNEETRALAAIVSGANAMEMPTLVDKFILYPEPAEWALEFAYGDMLTDTDTAVEGLYFRTVTTQSKTNFNLLLNLLESNPVAEKALYLLTETPFEDEANRALLEFRTAKLRDAHATVISDANELTKIAETRRNLNPEPLNPGDLANEVRYVLVQLPNGAYEFIIGTCFFSNHLGMALGHKVVAAGFVGVDLLGSRVSRIRIDGQSDELYTVTQHVSQINKKHPVADRSGLKAAQVILAVHFDCPVVTEAYLGYAG